MSLSHMYFRFTNRGFWLSALCAAAMAIPAGGEIAAQDAGSAAAAPCPAPLPPGRTSSRTSLIAS